MTVKHACALDTPNHSTQSRFFTDRGNMKSSILIAVVLAISASTSAAPVNQCACASVDTDIEKTYGSKVNGYGILTAPNCLPYNGDQAAIIDGRIYAHVSYNSQSAWLLTADIYIKDCHESFDCVCTTSNTEVKSLHSTSSQTLASLTSGQCVSMQGKVYNSSTDTWVQVNDNHQTGWVKKENVVFHKNCQGTVKPHTSASLQLPGCPHIITRAEWGARKPVPGTGTLTKTPYYAFIHHGATAPCHTREECVRMIQSYQNYHMDGHGWNDIGYSFVVGEDGNVYEGRGWDEIGAHTHNYNTIGLGFCVIGNFMQRPPDQLALDAVKKIIECGVANGKLTSTYTLLGHRDTNTGTLCPGDKYYDLIQSWKHYKSTVIPS